MSIEVRADFVDGGQTFAQHASPFVAPLTGITIAKRWHARRFEFGATGPDHRIENRMSQMEQVMDEDLSERIRGRAYEIWIAGGYRDGEADQHWLAAEQEILSGLPSAAVAKAPAKRIRGRATVKRAGGRPD